MLWQICGRPPLSVAAQFGNMSGFIASVRLENAASAGNEYPFSISAVAALAQFKKGLPLHPRITFFVGENGSGKSTLMEAIAVAAGFNPEGGSKHFNFSTRASHSKLHGALRLVRTAKRPSTGFFLRAESFFNVATSIDALGVTDAYGGRSLHEQSHGESFLALLQHRFGPRGLYLLDEPESALSPRRQLAVLALLHRLMERESQLVIATHSPILLALPGALIYELSERGIQPIAYEDTDQFQITKSFTADPATFLEMLLGKPTASEP